MKQITTQLIKGKDIVGLKVITLQKGQTIDDVDELIYDPRNDQIVALVVDQGGWFSDAKVILFKDIKTIGKDAIIIESEKIVKKASDVRQNISRIIKDDNYLTENVIITEDGTELGKVSDVYFNTETGKVVELEVSQGIKNFQSGKKRVKVSDIVKVGEDATIVKAYVEEIFAEQANDQGLQGAFVKTKSTTQEKTPDLIEQVKGKAQELTAKLQSQYEEVRNDPENKERLANLQDKTTSTFEQGKNVASEKLQQGKELAQEKFGQSKDAVTQKKDETQEQLFEKRKKDVLGKYVTINIISQNDSLLASRGDMITHTLLDQAEQNGMLEQVLGNTSAESLQHTSPREVKTPTEKIEVTMHVDEDEPKASFSKPNSSLNK